MIANERTDSTRDQMMKKLATIGHERASNNVPEISTKQ